MQQAGNLGNAKNFFKGIQTLMEDSLATQHNYINTSTETTSKTKSSEASTTIKNSNNGRQENRKLRTSKVCGDLTDLLNDALEGIRDLEIGRFSSFKL